MKLQEIFEQLTYGELSQLSIGGGEAGEINSSNYERVLAHVNLGLTALYKRFFLKESQLVLQLVQGKLDYSLHSRYAISNLTSTEPVKYILDASAPFQDDILNVLRVYSEEDYEFSVNNLDDTPGVRTPHPTTLRIPGALLVSPDDLPDEMRGSTLRVVYRANHLPIKATSGVINPEAIEVDLPYTHLEALLYFVAARAHTPIGMAQEGQGGNTYLQKYELACQQLELADKLVEPGGQPNRLARNGWV